jgi:hypothetical protein
MTASTGASYNNQTGRPSTPRDWNSKTPSGYKQGYMQQFDPGQMQLFEQNKQMLGPDSYLGRLAAGDQSQFEEMEAPAWQQFNQAQGNIASRFSGMGGLGAQKSSGFRNSMGQLGSDFAQQLASKRMDYRRQAINDLMGFSNTLLQQRPYDQFLYERPEAGWKNLARMGLTGAGTAAGAYFGGPKGAQVGFETGNAMSQYI